MRSAEEVTRMYAAAFLVKMLAEVDGGDRKPVEHVFRNLALFLSPPVTAIDGGGVPLAELRGRLVPGIAASYDKLGLDGARLADAILECLPYEGRSAYDPHRIIVPYRRSSVVDQSLQSDTGFLRARTTVKEAVTSSDGIGRARGEAADRDSNSNPVPLLTPEDQADELLLGLFKRKPLSSFQRRAAGAAVAVS